MLRARGSQVAAKAPLCRRGAAKSPKLKVDTNNDDDDDDDDDGCFQRIGRGTAATNDH